MAIQQIFTGLILAGGASSRMGRDKAMLRIGRETLLDRARRILRDSGADRLHVLGRPDEPDGLADAEPGAGPARAVLSAMQRLQLPGTGLVLIIPVDMPGLTVAALHTLLAQGGPARYAGEPLPLVLTAASLGQEADQARSMQALARACRAVEITRPDDDTLFANFNTPGDVARLLRG